MDSSTSSWAIYNHPLSYTLFLKIYFKIMIQSEK
jgi:hypothetical protein